MKKQFMTAGLWLALVLGSAADSGIRAMVLKVDGVFEDNKPVLTGQVVEPGHKLSLTKKSRLTLLLLNRGQRLEIQGQGWLQLGDRGLELSPGLKSVELDSNLQKLSLTGDNQRHIGGGVFRTQAPQEVLKDTLFDRIEVLDGSAGLVFWRAAGPGAPPKLRFRYLYAYRSPKLSEGKVVFARPESKDEVWSSLVEGERQGSRWRWELAWPHTDDQRMGLLVTSESGNEPLLYTMVYQTSPQEENELAQARTRVTAWSKREPKSIEPLVFYASLLEERGRLEEANQQLTRALALAGRDSGLREMKARVLWELGRYSRAPGFSHSGSPERVKSPPP